MESTSYSRWDSSGTAKKLFFVDRFIFLSSCFWTVLRYGWHLHIYIWNAGAPRWSPEHTVRLNKVPVNLRSWIWCVLQRVECKRLCGLKRTFVLICSTNVLFLVQPLSFMYKFYLGEKLITQPLTLASIPPILFVSPLLFSPFSLPIGE